MFFAGANFVLNDSGFPNSWFFCGFTVSIKVFNPHKTSVLNHPESAPSSMPFISNFDFSYTKCHVFESHCRYQRIQSSLNELGWIFLRCFAQVLHYYLLTKRPYAMEDFRWWFLFKHFLDRWFILKLVHQNKKQRTNSSWLICGTIRKIEYESGKEKSDGCGVSLRRRARK